MKNLAAFLLTALLAANAYGFPYGAIGGGLQHPLGIDGSTGTVTSGSTVTLTLSTTYANDIIVVAGAQNSTNSNPYISAISDTAGLSWHSRATGGNSNQAINEWYAVAPSPLSSDVITITTGTNIFYAAETAFGISGVNTSSVFDSNASLPASVASSTVTSVSTSNAHDILLSFYRQSGTATPTAGSGFTAIYAPSNGYFIAQYKIVTSTQSSLSIGVGGGTTNTDSNGGIADAMKGL